MDSDPHRLLSLWGFSNHHLLGLKKTCFYPNEFILQAKLKVDGMAEKIEKVCAIFFTRIKDI